MQFSTKIDGFEQKDSQGFENSYNSYEQYPLENFFIFTIYQNYTLALMKDPKEKQWCFNNITDIGPSSVSYFDVHDFDIYSIFCMCFI